MTKETLTEKFRKNLIDYRSNKGLTQDEMAQKLDMSLRYYQKFEAKKPKNITLETLEKICESLGVAAYKFLQ